METNVLNLKIARLASGRRLLDAARDANMSESVLSRIENGDAPIDRRQLERIAVSYGVSIAVLLGHEPLVIAGRAPRISR